MENKNVFPKEKRGLHPRDRHRSRYDFDSFSVSCLELVSFLALTDMAGVLPQFIWINQPACRPLGAGINTIQICS
jgi:23S rRNA (adenine1618-N6)-methyltransferase